MEDDEFELVAKGLVKKLREENKKLKNLLDKTPNNKKEESSTSKFIPELLKALHEEGTKERELITAQLGDIKDLNKKTLDNVLVKTQSLDSRLQKLIESISDLISNLSHLSKEISNKEHSTSIAQELDEIKMLIPSSDTNTQEITLKLQNLEEFMKKLEMLLSQVKRIE